MARCGHGGGWLTRKVPHAVLASTPTTASCCIRCGCHIFWMTFVVLYLACEEERNWLCCFSNCYFRSLMYVGGCVRNLGGRMITQDDSYLLLCQNLSVPGTSIVSKLSSIETSAWLSSQLDSPVIQQYSSFHKRHNARTWMQPANQSCPRTGAHSTASNHKKPCRMAPPAEVLGVG